MTSLTDKEEELPQDDVLFPPTCNQVRVIDLVKGQQEDPSIGRVLKFIKATRKPTVTQKRREPPPVRKYLSDNLCKSGPLHFGSENQFPSNFTHETILV